MFVTAKDFQENFSKYLELVQQEDILITEAGDTVAIMKKFNKPQTSATDYLYGLLENMDPLDIDKHKIREMRLTERYDSGNA